jgi:hypothetical protein
VEVLMAQRTKDPQSSRLLTRDWAPWLNPEEEIIDATWDVAGPDNVLTVANFTVAGFQCTCLVSGGTPGATYVVTCRVTTSLGQVEDANITIFVSLAA